MHDIERYTQAYIRSDFEDVMVAYRRKMLLEQLAKYPHASVLEIGCGMEPLFKYMDGVEQWVIVEPSSLFCRRARESAKPLQNVTVIEGRAEEAGERLEAFHFDIIVCSSLLHELPQPENMLRLIGALCDETTVVHVNVPNALSLHRLLAVEMGLMDSPYGISDTQKRLQQHQTFDMPRFRALVEQEGFTVLDSGTYFVKLFTHAQLQKGLEQGVFSRQMLDGLYNLIRYLPDNGAELYLNLAKRV